MFERIENLHALSIMIIPPSSEKARKGYFSSNDNQSVGLAMVTISELCDFVIIYIFAK